MSQTMTEPTGIDWDRVLELRRRYVASGTLSKAEIDFLQHAVSMDPKRYRAMNEAVLDNTKASQ